MKEFLEFMNSSTVDELQSLAGITPAQAMSVLAARPFSSLDDLTRVKEVSAEELAKFRSAYEDAAQHQPEIEPVGHVRSEKDEAPAPKRNRLGRVLIRILVILLVLAALFAAVYFGVPLFKEKILNPLQNNTSRVSEIATQQAADVQQLTNEIAALTDRVSTLEARADAVDIALKTNSQNIAALKELQGTLQVNLKDQKSEMLSELDQQLTLTRAIEYLSRSRLYLSQSNNGLARDDAAAARSLLYSLLDTLPADQVDSMKVVIARVDNALVNLPAYPVVAVYDIDAAWQLLVDGLPNVPTAAVTPVISGTLPGALTEPTLEVTPTP